MTPARKEIREKPRRALLIAHGSSHRPEAIALTEAIADRLRGVGDYDRVAIAALHGEPGIRVSLESLGDGPVDIFPLFMSDGFLTRTRIPSLMGTDPSDPRIRYHRPVGCHAAMPGLVAAEIGALCRSRDLDPGSATILIVGHGSSRPSASRDGAEAIASGLRRLQRFGTVETAYLEEAPRLGEWLAACRPDGPPIVVFGLFLGAGQHASVDLPEVLARHREVLSSRIVAMQTMLGNVEALADLVRSIADEEPQIAPARRAKL